MIIVVYLARALLLNWICDKTMIVSSFPPSNEETFIYEQRYYMI